MQILNTYRVYLKEYNHFPNKNKEYVYFPHKNQEYDHFPNKNKEYDFFLNCPPLYYNIHKFDYNSNWRKELE